jgi:putative membrane protein
MTPLAHHPDATGEALATVALVVVLGLLAAGYARGVHEIWARRGTGAVIPVWRVLGFVSGLAALLTALTGPLHELAERSLAGHMTQHMVLLVAAGPLLATGAAGLPLALAGPRWLRRRWARWRSGPVGARLRRPAVLAIVLAATQGVVIWAWHLPTLYVLALRSEPVHLVEHACFVVAATLFWSTILGAPHHRLPPPVSVLLLFATMLPTSALGAVLTLAPGPIYPADVLSPAGGGLPDQQLAGLVMWIPMDVLGLVAALAVFVRWLARLDRALPAGHEVHPVDALRPAVEGGTR